MGAGYCSLCELDWHEVLDEMADAMAARDINYCPTHGVELEGDDG